jgi:hypothetical protein
MRPPGSFADDPPPHASVFVVGQSNLENERGQPKLGGVRHETRSGEFVSSPPTLIAVDLGTGETASPVHIVWDDSDLELRSRPVWPTIRVFVETVIATFEEGLCSVNDNGVVDGPAIDHWSEQKD